MLTQVFGTEGFSLSRSWWAEERASSARFFTRGVGTWATHSCMCDAFAAQQWVMVRERNRPRNCKQERGWHHTARLVISSMMAHGASLPQLRSDLG